MNESQNTEQVQLSLKEIFRVLLKRWWIILLCTIIGAGGAFLYAYMPDPQYESEVQIYVNNRNNISVDVSGLTSGDLSASKSLSDLYILILKSRETMEAVIAHANLNCSYEQLLAMIDAKTVGSSPVLSITVTSGDPEQACLIANTISLILPDRIDTIVQQASSNIVDHAVVAQKEVSRQYPKKMVIGMLLGLLLSACACLVYDLFINDKIQSEDWLTQTFGEDIPVLAVIPDANDRHHAKYGHYYGSGKTGASGGNGGQPA